MAIERYGINFHTTDSRGHAHPNRVGFSCDSADAAALTAAYEAAVQGTPTSVVQRVYETPETGAYPVGTAYTAYAVLKDVNGAAYTVRLRNFKGATYHDVDIENLFGNVSGGATTPVAGNIYLPNSGLAQQLVNGRRVLRY